MTWAGLSINGGLPLCGRRVPTTWVEDESFYWSYDDELYQLLY
jgi:hypothetical protein